MAIATISEVIERGEVSIYLSGNDNSKGAMFGSRRAAPGSQVTIAMITDALNWGNAGGAQSAEDLRQMANYLTWLIGRYGQQAEYILEGSGGGAVIPGGGGTLATPLYFYVSASSFVATGETTVTMPTSWTGYNLAFSRNGVVQTTVDTEPTYFSYDTDSREFICTPAAVEGELFALIPV